MRLARENGAEAYNGLKMLLYQGIAGYEMWNQTKVSEDVVEKVYEKLQQKVKK